MTNSSSWKSLSEAAEILGVHFSTLRRWADRGLIDYVRTPGGKRKFQQKAIDAFVERFHNYLDRPLALVKLEDEAVRKTRENLRSIGLPQQGWYLQLTEDQRAQMRGTGNRLIALLLHYCTHEEDGSVFLDEARRITGQYGEICSTAGMTMSECIHTFLMFRRPMISAIHETGSLHGAPNETDQQVLEKMTVFLDETMVAMVEMYYQHNNQICSVPSE